ncbi:MAG: tryptophan synthase subunit alpha [Actinomycetes bacterium]
MSSSDLDRLLASARAENRAVLVGYLPAGYPSVPGAVEAITAMVRGGVDVVEVGLPYSDPLMDGPTIQRAVDVALAGGTTTDDVVTTVGEVAAGGTPTLVMSYWNPIERYGARQFADALTEAGAAGVITPDLTPDEAGTDPSDWLGATDAAGLGRVFLVAPSSTDDRLRYTAGHCRGFVYAASTMGVTGARDAVGGAAEILVRRTRAVTDKPVCVGLGVSTGDQAAQVASFADGVIVGSAFVRALLDATTPDDGLRAVEKLAAELADGVRRGRA